MVTSDCGGCGGRGIPASSATGSSRWWRSPSADPATWQRRAAAAWRSDPDPDRIDPITHSFIHSFKIGIINYYYNSNNCKLALRDRVRDRDRRRRRQGGNGGWNRCWTILGSWNRKWSDIRPEWIIENELGSIGFDWKWMQWKLIWITFKIIQLKMLDKIKWNFKDKYNWNGFH